MAVLAVIAMAMPPAPIPNMATRESGIEREAASTTSSTPSTAAPPISTRIPGRRPKAMTRAAASDPTPDAAIRKPNPWAPVPSTSRASEGMTTEKFIPAVATSPTTPTARSTMRVCLT